MLKASRVKTCLYRHCDEDFQDTSPKNSRKFCCSECRRREKLFRLGKAKDESYFRSSRRSGRRTCYTCGGTFYLEREEKNNRCPSCRDKARNKQCRKCGSSYRDESAKNTCRFCPECRTQKRLRATVSDRQEQRRKRRVKLGEGGRIDDLRTIPKGSASWWGRVGELLFLHLYPDASDSVAEYGNGVSFDAQHRSLGRVQVKTVRCRATKYGRTSWSFLIRGVAQNSDTAFLIGLSRDRCHVESAWLIPSSVLPESSKVLTPNSKEYDSKEFEVSPEHLDIMNRYLGVLLGGSTPKSKVQPNPEYERMVLGRIGEAIYKCLHPESFHVAAKNVLASHDFRDKDGTTVNVRVRRLGGKRSRWTFFRSPGCDADHYFFLGLDRLGRTVEVAYRVPETELPEHGFSVSGKGKSKWDQYLVLLGLPKPVGEFVGVDDFNDTHLAITGLSTESVAAMNSVEKEALLRRAFSYHRVLGFPYPAPCSDKRLSSYVRSIQEYLPQGKTLPIENAGLGFCSVYMPHRFEARNKSSTFSAYGAYHDDDYFRKVLRFCLRGRNPSLRRSAVRSSLTALTRTPTQFRPAVAHALVQAYSREGDTVLDPCAGWGGRLMGTLVAGRKYVGVEPSKKTADALYNLGMRLCEYLVVDRGQVRILESPIQVLPSGTVKAHFALSSPPYWDQEIYGEHPEKTLEQWSEEFLAPMFDRVRGNLLAGGRFAVNIADLKRGTQVVPLEEITLATGERNGFELESAWRMMKSSFGDQPEGQYEPIFVFRAC